MFPKNFCHYLAVRKIMPTFAGMMRKATLSIWAVVILLLLLGCGLDRAERVRQLEMLEAHNRVDSVMQDDSLAKELVDYFDRHGSANERMRIRYMLGRIYYKLDELPRALETYLEAVSYADTANASQEDYKVLSRIHAQSAIIYHSQVQPESELAELREAERYGWYGLDTIQAIECHAQQSGAYSYMHKPDSAILLAEEASEMYAGVGANRRAATTLSGSILSLLQTGNFVKARKVLERYELESGLFDPDGNIESGREIYYYVKGEFYLAIHQPDSAESFFRREQTTKDLNNQIASVKGLMEVFKQKKIPDSIAKYASLAYQLNDSAYSLSEMQNIQKLRAAYNFSHNKQLAEQSQSDLKFSYLYITILSLALLLVILFVVVCWNSVRRKNKAKEKEYAVIHERLASLQKEVAELFSDEKLSGDEVYEKKSSEIEQLVGRLKIYNQNLRKKKSISIEQRIKESDIVRRLHDYTTNNPYKQASCSDFSELRRFMNETLPDFYGALYKHSYTPSEMEYNVSVLIRCSFSPSEIHKLTGLSMSYISNMRSRLLQRIFGKEGTPKDYDNMLMFIK